MEHKLVNSSILSVTSIFWKCSCGKTGVASMGYQLTNPDKQAKQLHTIARRRVYQHGRRAAHNAH